MAQLVDIQQPFQKEEEKITKEVEREIKKETQDIRNEIVAVAATYNAAYSGGPMPKAKQKEMDKQINGLNLFLAAIIASAIYKQSYKNMDNKYLGNVYSYAKVSKGVVNYKYLTDFQKRITIMDKIQGKSYVKRLNIHSKTLTKTTGAIIKNGIRLGFSDEQIAKNITKRIGVNFNQSLTIARTEVARVGSIAEEKAAKLAIKQGLVFTKKWKHYSSPGERADHIQMDGVVVKGPDLFTLPNGETCPRPRIGLSAGQTINCQCQAEDSFVKREGKYEEKNIPSYKKWEDEGVGLTEKPEEKKVSKADKQHKKWTILEKNKVVKSFDTKKEARNYGMKERKKGREVFLYSNEDRIKILSGQPENKK